MNFKKISFIGRGGGGRGNRGNFFRGGNRGTGDSPNY